MGRWEGLTKDLQATKSDALTKVRFFRHDLGHHLTSSAREEHGWQVATDPTPEARCQELSIGGGGAPRISDGCNGHPRDDQFFGCLRPDHTGSECLVGTLFVCAEADPDTSGRELLFHSHLECLDNYTTCLRKYGWIEVDTQHCQRRRGINGVRFGDNLLRNHDVLC